MDRRQLRRRMASTLRGDIPPWLMNPAKWLEGTNFIWLMPGETESSSAIPASKHPLRMAAEWPNYNVSSWAAAARRTDHGIPERLADRHCTRAATSVPSYSGKLHEAPPVLAGSTAWWRRSPTTPNPSVRVVW